MSQNSDITLNKKAFAKNNMDQITSNLFLSSVFAAKNQKCLERHQIQNVLSILSYSSSDYKNLHQKYDLSEGSSQSRSHQKNTGPSPPKKSSSFDKLSEVKLKKIGPNIPQAVDKNENSRTYKIYSDIADVPGTADKIRLILPECIQFIHQKRKLSENVLVHCVAGKSRSASVVIAYLMAVTNTSFESVYKKIRSKREVNPNSGYEKMLKDLDVAPLQKLLNLTEENYAEEAAQFYSDFCQMDQ